MKVDLLKSYIKYSYRSIILGVFSIFLISWLVHDSNPIISLILLVCSITQGYYQYNNKLEKIKRLKAKGLTEQDPWNIEFVKKWENTRQDGLWKYCIRDGGIITGAGLSLLISIIYFVTVSNAIKNLESDPGNIFSFIGYAYISGAVIGVITYRILWWYNEKRFTRLTDPFNTIFTSKKASFND